MVDVAGVAHTQTEEGLFTRQSSGLVRALGVSSAVSVAIASVWIVSIFINFSAALAGFTKLDMVVPILLAAAIWFVALFAYRNLVEAMPRAGGEYMYLSRVISPAVGAMAGISIAVVFLFFLGTNGNFFAQYLPLTLQATGEALHSSSIANAAGHITSHGSIAIISAALLVVAGLCAVLPVRSAARLIGGLVVLQLVAFLVAGFILLTHSHADFIAALGRYSHNPAAYHEIVSSAAAAHLPTGVALGASLAAVPFLFLSFNGSLYAYYVGGELRRPGRTYLIASSITIGLLTVLWIGMWLVMRHTAGLHLIQAQAQLNAADPNRYAAITSLQASSSGLGYALVLAGDPVTKILIGLAVPAAAAAGCIAFVLVVTRILFALAFDRLLPVGVASITGRGVPMVAIAVALTGAIAFAVLNAFGTLTTIVANLSLFTALIIFAGSVAATALPFRRPDLMMKAGKRDVDRVGGVPTAAIWGAASTVLAATMVALIVSHPAQFGSLSFVSLGSLCVIVAAGPVLYLVVRTVRARSASIDLRLAMHELPPD